MTAPADSIDSISPLAKLALTMRIARAADFRDTGPRRARPRGERGSGSEGGNGSGSGAAKT